MIGVDMIGRIRRAYFDQHRPIKEIVRTLSVSRATVRKVVRSQATEFKYERGVQPVPKLGEWVGDLTAILEREAKLPRRERRSTQRLFEELRGRGYDGAHDSVHRFAKLWREERARVPARAFVPMSFAPGEAYQFDWSHETITLQGLPLTIKAAHMKLSHSRMPFAGLLPRDPGTGLRRPRQGVRVLRRNLPPRHLRQSMDVSRARRSVGAAAGMHESIRPVAGRFAPLALMGVRLLLAS
jgi:hypothetical protein